MKVRSRAVFVLALFLLLDTALVFAASDTTSEINHTEATQVLGRSTKATIKSGTTDLAANPSVPATTPVYQSSTSVSATILGIAIEALFAFMSPPNTIDGVTYAEVFSFDRRVFSEQITHQTGPMSWATGLAPTEVRVAIVRYPIGPVLFQIDGGARVQGNVTLTGIPEISIPAEYSMMGLQLAANLSAAAYLEAYAKFLFLRGGVGGQLNLIDANAQLNARFAFDGHTNPITVVSAFVTFMKGRFYAFVDYFSIFPWKWRRLFDRTLSSWNGKCFSAGATSCPAK